MVGGGGEGGDLVSAITRIRNSGVREEKNCFLSKHMKLYVTTQAGILVNPSFTNLVLRVSQCKGLPKSVCRNQPRRQ